jgi:hypothetical protein
VSHTTQVFNQHVTLSPEDQVALREQRKALEGQFTRLYPVEPAANVNVTSTPEGHAGQGIGLQVRCPAYPARKRAQA